MRNHKSLSYSRLALMPLVLGMSFLFSCAGNERAPHQPVKGVDTEKNEVKNPYDKMSVHPAPGIGNPVASHSGSSGSIPSEKAAQAETKNQGENQGQQSKGGEESGQSAFAFLDTFRQANR